MDKRIFQLRHGLCKQVIILILVSTLGFSQKSETQPVFHKNKIVGFLNQSANRDYNNCYFFSKKTVFNKKINFKIIVEINKINEENLFIPLYNVKISRFSENIKIVEFSSTVNSNFYRLYVSNVKNKLLIIKKISYSNGVYVDKINDENDMFPSTHICINEQKKNIVGDTLIFDTLFKFNKSECFDCPIKYSLEDCLKIRKSKQKVKWE